MPATRRQSARALAAALLLVLGCQAEPIPAGEALRFTIAVIPDTQNYVDYSHQQSEGFAIDASELFLAQMRDIAARKDVAFVAAVGDVWQHATLRIDPEHAERGFEAIPNPFFDSSVYPTPRTRDTEIPKAVEGYRILAAAGIPFGVAPGNHDYDAMWSQAGFPPDLQMEPRTLRMSPDDLGMLHIGGLDNFRSVFGNEGEFFRDKKWYVDSYRGGANSAQLFRAGGYEFLHITLEMSPDDGVLQWATTVLELYPGLPTILTTHDYLDGKGRRRANPIIDLPRVDPQHHNTAEEVFAKLIEPNDQVFLVLCGHHHGQSHRIDVNDRGHEVYQILADYQDRGQAGLDGGQPPGRRGPVGIGDGWYRLMHFDLQSEPPRVEVRTWSSHYRSWARDHEHYADWYREHEQPELDDAAFVAEDSFELVLRDFRERFGPPRSLAAPSARPRH